MPLTPFHLGPGALLKAAIPRQLSITTFVCAQVAVDADTLWHLLRSRWPSHGILHSIPGAIAVGLCVGAVMHLVGKWLLSARLVRINAIVRAEWNWIGVLMGSILGGATHSLLDAIMHSDVQPLWPFISGNIFFNLLNIATLYSACIAAGVVGVAWFLWRLHLEYRTG